MLEKKSSRLFKEPGIATPPVRKVAHFCGNERAQYWTCICFKPPSQLWFLQKVLNVFLAITTEKLLHWFSSLTPGCSKMQETAFIPCYFRISHIDCLQTSLSFPHQSFDVLNKHLPQKLRGEIKEDFWRPGYFVYLWLFSLDSSGEQQEAEWPCPNPALSQQGSATHVRNVGNSCWECWFPHGNGQIPNPAWVRRAGSTPCSKSYRPYYLILA